MVFSFPPSRRASAAAAGLALAAALVVLPAIHASAAAVSVPCTGTNSTDVAALKAAITAANIAGGQTLSLGAGCTFTLSTIDNGANGLPLITSTMTIIGNGDTITRSTAGATPAFRIFEVSNTGNLTLSGLVLTHGDGGGGAGGAVAAIGSGVITIDASTLSGNTAPGSDGGAIFTRGVLTISNSNILNNTVTNAHDGGGLGAEGSGQVTITGSTFAGNDTAAGFGGAIETSQPLRLINSTVTGNTSGRGAGVYDNGTGGVLSILDSTLAGNTASVTNGGGGIANTGAPAGLVVADTIVSNNTQGNCGSAAGLGAVHDGGNNLENGTSCAFATSAVNADPGLGALASNGGPTQTRAITSSSATFQAGNPTVCAAAVPNGAGGVDQRGVARKAACDIGAFEAAATPTPTPTGVPVPESGAVSGGPASPASGLLVALGVLLLIGAVAVSGRLRRGPIA